MSAGRAVLLVLIGQVGLGAPDSLFAQAPDFAREVRPILASYCFKCHGPDEAARKSNLRLDVAEGAVTPAKSGTVAVVPGDPDRSAVIQRLDAADPDELMPPPGVKHPLTEAQKDVLRRWVQHGAEYQEHWAYIPPRQPPVPEVKNSGWPRGSIDRFVLARLEAEGLSPSAEADRTTLVRRVSLDLTGLPPTIEEADAFLSDTSPNAYESLVDRLLASPRYGERWARRWLDLARYADTNGYEKDRSRSIWPWRDWVIRALNSDMPFDRFTVEQLAGDLLPHRTEEQIVATGFHRNTMLNEEGGIDPLEFRFHAMTDRVSTTGTTWLGLTLGCAQCHTHKSDPIRHTEYYQLMAFLNNAEEPSYEIGSHEDAAARSAREAEVAQLIAALPSHWPPAAPDTGENPAGAPSADAAAPGKPTLEESKTAWIANLEPKAAAWITPRPKAMTTNSPKLAWQDDGSIFASGDFTKEDHYELIYDGVPAGVTALRLEALPDPRLPELGPGITYYEGPRGDFFIGHLTVSGDAGPVALTRTSATAGNAALMVDDNLQSGWNGSGQPGDRHSAVLVLEKPWPGGTLTLRFQSGRHYAASLGLFRVSFTSRPGGAEAVPVEPAVEDILRLPASERTAEHRALLEQAFLFAAPELAEETKHIRERMRPPRGQETLVLRERPANHPRPTRRHHRGEYLQPEEPVTPGVPAFLPPLPSDAPVDRLGLAQWLVSPGHPLTARVTVNRQWAALFGAGLVKSLGDFGYQGDLPSHPELLDWLAVHFVHDGWSLKRLHRLIVLSATYRQSSALTPALRAVDPQNRLLARGPRFRVEAEMVRDITLRASGLLSDKMFGPPVRPPQPAGVTETAYGGAGWDANTGEDRYRRALYTFAKRSAPFAAGTTFDAPTGEACIARRDFTNTPLQSLTLLNDPAFIEAAQALGRLAAATPGDDRTKLVQVFRRCLTRAPRDPEVATLITLLDDTRDRLARGELAAADITPPEGTGQTDEGAAWTVVARALLNLDETITKS